MSGFEVKYQNPEDLDVGDTVTYALGFGVTLKGTVTKRYPSHLLAVHFDCEILVVPKTLHRPDLLLKED